jgi:hypothetical protein
MGFIGAFVKDAGGAHPKNNLKFVTWRFNSLPKVL